MAEAGKSVSDQMSEAAQVESGDNHKSSSEPQDVIGTPIQFSQKCKTIIEAIINDLNACDVKWNLFTTAVQNNDNYKRMLPYLPGFIKNHTHLMTLINDVPHMYEIYRRLMKQIRCCDKLSILLVYWVLFDLKLPTFQSLCSEDIDEFVSSVPQNHSFKKPTYAFRVDYDENSEEEKLFKARSENYPTRYSFFGCATENLFEILCDGFSRYRDSGSNGIPFNSECELVLNGTPSTKCIGESSMCDSFKAVALCEFIERRDYMRTSHDNNRKCSHIHIEVPDMVRIRFVFFYCENVKEFVEDNDPIEESIFDKVWKSDYFLPVTGCAIVVSALAYVYRKELKDVLYSIARF